MGRVKYWSEVRSKLRCCDVCGYKLDRRCWNLIFQESGEEVLIHWTVTPDSMDKTVIHYHASCVPRGILKFLSDFREQRLKRGLMRGDGRCRRIK